MAPYPEDFLSFVTDGIEATDPRDGDRPVITFVTPHRCEACGYNTDVSPCHRCGHRDLIEARAS